jgi:hypothetical protein
MAADCRLGEEEIIRRLRKTLQVSDPTEGLQVAKVDGQLLSLHNELNIKPIYFQMQE